MQHRHELIREHGAVILQKLTLKGWNAYFSNERIDLGLDAAVSCGPIENLELYQRYIVLPSVQNPRDYTQVMEAFSRVAATIKRKKSTIDFGVGIYEWVGFKPLATKVRIITPDSHFIEYPRFVTALDSLFDVSQL